MAVRKERSPQEVLGLRKDTYSIEPTELVAAHGDNDSGDLPSHRARSQQLHHRHQLGVPLDSGLCQNFFYFMRHIIFPKEPPKCCKERTCTSGQTLGTVCIFNCLASLKWKCLAHIGGIHGLQLNYSSANNIILLWM